MAPRLVNSVARIFRRIAKHSIVSGMLIGLIGGWPQTYVSAGGADLIGATCAESVGQTLPASVVSKVYSASIPINIYLPPCYRSLPDNLSAIYLLHGANADHTQWPDLDVQPRADELIAQGVAPFIVVMPAGDYQADIDYAAFIMNDLIPYVERHFQVTADREHRAIGGLSMGGYWALKIAFSHPDRFVAVGGYSPVASIGYADDPIVLARTADQLDRLSIALDVGEADGLLAGAQRLTQVLQARDLKVSLSVNPGGHARAYWRSHTGEYLTFYARAFYAANLPYRRRCYVDAERQ